MAGSDEGGGSAKPRESDDSSFRWDEDSKLYFHPSSGFYYDPNAGWYYSSRDGLYYTFEDGRYVLLSCNKQEESETPKCTSSAYSESIQDKTVVAEHATASGSEEYRPPSEWLEDTLIELFLSRNSRSDANADSSPTALGIKSEEKSQVFREWQSEEWVPEGEQDEPTSSNIFFGEEASLDEDNWQAQYGQVVRLDDEEPPPFALVDLWDWEMVMEPVRKKHQVARLIGRLVKRSSKVHPSIPGGGGLLKTSPIREVHLDLVHVASGKVYKLRSPSRKYLASLSTYDSSNPTKDWGFPDLYANMSSITSHRSDDNCLFDTASAYVSGNSAARIDEVPVTVDKNQGIEYRDRAAERRILHGGFGIGPGQKNNREFGEVESSLQSSNTEEAAAEAMEISFGSGSYARRILENMGWKDGEALGRSRNGILEPLQAVGNKGYAGLGWNHTRQEI